MKYSALLLVLLCYLCGCTSQDKNPAQLDPLSIRMRSAPDALHPIVSRNTTAESLERLLFRAPQEMNPHTLQIEPVLLEHKPEITTLENQTVYSMQLRSDVSWTDGTPITSEDYAFTLKACMLPYIRNNRLYQFLNIIDSISVDAAQNRLNIWVGRPSMQTEDILTTLPLYPAHHYDDQNILSAYSFSRLKQITATETDGPQDGILVQFGAAFSSAEKCREGLLGAGPYILKQWSENEVIQLEKLENHWTQNAADFVQAKRDEIEFRFMPEAQLAISGLKNNNLDVIADVPAEDFRNLQTQSAADFHYARGSSLRYFYIALNNADPILSDIEVRKALAHTMDVQSCIDRLFFGYAQRLSVPINPDKPYYARELKPIPFQLEAAAVRLDKAGWHIGPKGIREKSINGKIAPLALSLTTSTKGLSKDVGLIFQEAAAEIGIQINLKPQQSKQTMQQVRSGTYQMACLAASQVPGLDDVYPQWHSEGGRNYCAFQNEAIDQISEQIRTSTDQEERNRLYKAFQQQLYAEQPAIFLVTPEYLLATQKNLRPEMTIMAPGFFANELN